MNVGCLAGDIEARELDSVLNLFYRDIYRSIKSLINSFVITV
jgi:hypothetical protein